MKNTFGTNVSVTLFGESHGEVIGAVLDGVAPGVRVDEELIEKRLGQRQGLAEISTARRESDSFRIVSGVFNNITTGTPICVLIRNSCPNSGDYERIKSIPRPSHADYTFYEKYHGFNDYRGGGHSSGRLTAPLVAVGTICETMLKAKGIDILTHIKSCGANELARDCDFSDIAGDRERLERTDIPVLDEKAAEIMKAEIIKAKSEGDSLGGIIETVISGVPAGVGEPWFDTVEGALAHAMFSIPAVKGIEFGGGFELATAKGSEANDQMRFENGKVHMMTNRNGGILGGVTSGSDIVFRLAIKPTPSISKAQKTVDLNTGENTETVIGGRHDPFIAHKAAVVATSLAAVTVCDLLTARFGTEFFVGGGNQNEDTCH